MAEFELGMIKLTNMLCVCLICVFQLVLYGNYLKGAQKKINQMF